MVGDARAKLPVHEEMALATSRIGSTSRGGAADGRQRVLLQCVQARRAGWTTIDIDLCIDL